jgi:hypothetical protein
LGRQEDACWRCGEAVRHVHFSGHRPNDPAPPSARRPHHSDALASGVRRGRSAARAVVAFEVRESRPVEPQPVPCRAEDLARRRAQRLDAERRRRQELRELAAAIDRGDAAHRRLCERLDEFGARLAVVRLTLSTMPVGGPPRIPASAEVAAVATARRRSRQREAMRLRTADGAAS